jgi:photosystem II stability/assembly factor-like uncharacterized protein
MNPTRNHDIVGTVWEPIGPSPLAQGGRPDNGLTSAIAVNPNNPSIVYQGTAGGGVWRTNDSGATWTPIFDQQISLGVGNPSALAIDPNDTNTIYVGTSNRLARQASAGLFKSTDSGASWVRLGFGFPAGNMGDATQFRSRRINVVIVDPANSQTLYLACNTGVFRSVDGGLNWGAAGTGSNGDVRALVLDTTSPAGNGRILYAGITNNGLFQSTNGAQNWAQILGTATSVGAAPQAVATALSGGNFSKVLVDLAPPTSPPAVGGIQVVYASLSGTGTAPDPLGVFISTNQGATWTFQGSAGIPTNTQRGYSFHMAVDPASPGDGANDIIYLGAVGHGRSTDSGNNFTTLGGLHADNHTWAFAPQAGGTSTVFCGNDGGIFRSTDGTTWTALNSGGLQTALFYNMATRPDATASITLGSMQDNGVQTTSGGAGLGWISPQGGDGWDVAYDGVTAGQAYATSGFWPGQDPNGAIQACTRVFVSAADGTDLPPTVPTFGQAFPDVTPWFGAAGDQGCYLASLATDPSAAGIVYVAGNQNLWQSRDGGTTWNQIGAFATGFITARASVAPSNGNNVVVAAGTQVSVSTNALGPVANVTFIDITRNLPLNRNVLRAAFDPNDPTVIYAVLGGFNGTGPGQSGHVFRTTIGGTAWTDISPDLDVPHGALALDGSETPTAIYVGTDLGVLRSVDQGATWYVLDDIHFPNAPVSDLEIGRGSGILRVATYGRGVFEFRQPDGPAITVNLENGLEFGTACGGGTRLTLQIFNVGGADLRVDSVQRLIGSTAFEVDPLPATPLVIAAGEEVDFTVGFTPTTPGNVEMAIIRIVSNDPGAPYVDLLATGTGGVASAELAVADSGDFGEVCLGSFVDRDLVINNAGGCPLVITSINSSSADFAVPGVVTFPLVVAAGASVVVPLRFQPGTLGVLSATVSVVSNDPASPAQVDVMGTAPPPRLVLSIADAGDFGDVCVGDFRDLPVTLSNSGSCPLTISGMTSSSGEFIVPSIDVLPLTIAPRTSVTVALRFQPTSFGAKNATINVISDDPASPATLVVSGTAPSGELAITGTTDFGAVELGVRALQTVSICNVGACDLHVSKVAFGPLSPCEKHAQGRCHCGCGARRCGCHNGRKSGSDYQRPQSSEDEWDNKRYEDSECDCDQRCLNFRIVTNPFPATVCPGSCLGVLIEYLPTCDNAACCELVIESDDPDKPSETLFVTGRLRRTLRAALKCWAAQQLQEILDAGHW